MPDSLSSWLPKDPFDFTRVFAPVTIDDVARLDLEPYHPADSVDYPRNFRLARVKDEAVATVEIVDPEKNWSREFAAVMKTLRLRVVNAGLPDEYLLDDRVPQGGLNDMSGWKVTRWTIRRTRWNDDGEPIELSDQIEWTNAAGVVAASSYIWRPYKS